LPEFNGPRADDLALFPGFLDSVAEKNAYEGLPDIHSVVLDDNELLIRIYTGFGDIVLEDGRPSLQMYQVHFVDNQADMLWFPYCASGVETTRRSPYRTRTMIINADLFTIRDSRADPAAPQGMRDGTSHLIQIKSASAYREFMVSNPEMYESDDSVRLRNVLASLATEFDTPACVRQLLQGVPPGQK
jgi:hypothetical protein